MTGDPLRAAQEEFVLFDPKAPQEPFLTGTNVPGATYTSEAPQKNIDRDTSVVAGEEVTSRTPRESTLCQTRDDLYDNYVMLQENDEAMDSDLLLDLSAEVHEGLPTRECPA